MKYAYEDMSSKQFETLIVLLCQRLLGTSTQGFSDGPDGGRDAKFVGTAELHPSQASPWSGTTIIQAKHTNGFNRKFSESDFYSTKTRNTILGEELPRIKKLGDSKQLDHYMLFANRRLAGNAESQIRALIADHCSLSLESIYLCGVEQLELWLKKFPDVPQLADLDPVDCPLIVSPDDLAEVVGALAGQMGAAAATLGDPPVARVPYETKNKLNNMSADYAREQCKRYLKDTRAVHDFLAAPENDHLLRLYETVVEEFQLKIVAKRKDHQEFDSVLEHLVDLLISRDPDLRKNKRLTRVVLFYMYWNCDIGKNGNAQTD